VHPPGAVLDEHQHVQALAQDGVHMQECAARRLLILWR
jgi:hypothetical protein